MTGIEPTIAAYWTRYRGEAMKGPVSETAERDTRLVFYAGVGALLDIVTEHGGDSKSVNPNLLKQLHVEFDTFIDEFRIETCRDLSDEASPRDA